MMLDTMAIESYRIIQVNRPRLEASTKPVAASRAFWMHRRQVAFIVYLDIEIIYHMHHGAAVVLRSASWIFA